MLLLLLLGSLSLTRVKQKGSFRLFFQNKCDLKLMFLSKDLSRCLTSQFSDLFGPKESF